MSSLPSLSRRILAGALVSLIGVGAAGATGFPVTVAQRTTAQQVAQAGVPLEDIAPNAPDSHVVRPGDTLWHISGMFLKTPWRWPELWGLNLEQIRNPHLIYPGQLLVLEKIDGRARLRVGQAIGTPGSGQTVKLSPRVRSSLLPDDAIPPIPLHLIEPFLNEAIIFDHNELERAPRVVAAQEGRVLLTRGDRAYVRGELGKAREWRLFREAKPLRDPDTREILGYEAAYLGTTEYVKPAETGPRGEYIPASFTVLSAKQEVGVGDRLAPMPEREFLSYAPHAPQKEMDGRIVSIYGEALSAGQNQIVALNRGEADGLERGHVLALWRYGSKAVDRTQGRALRMQLPDERHGLLFVFRTFERMSYALILNVQEPVKVGDRFTQP
ncbi:LysM peptidoglycan-binding domain-containing protein [Caldimonas tepidiphila]|uniref:LysM peptidoglycan-binding domain-containing protein n=1 Tax=Caldimonas tepidiphila TaxID=2315841 RepID=UPI000E5A3BCB|nr:LysM peptidoglycan-binding domain-containing protein [Caldimonas tepidiphila]